MYDSREQFLARLYAETSKMSDFSSISESVWRLVAVMDLERERVELTQAVMADVALTQRVLGVANSAMYRRFGQNITTVSQAVVMLGYDMIGNVALGLKLASELTWAAQFHEARSRKALAECSMTGTLARHLAQQLYPPNAEEAGVCGLLHGLGRVLTMFYLPRAWDAVERCMAQEGVPEAVAMKQITHMTTCELGREVAAYWRVPESIVASLRDGTPDQSINMKTAPGDAEWLAVLAHTSATVTHRLAESGFAPSAVELRRLADEFSVSLSLRPGDFMAALESASKDEQASPLIGVDVNAPTAIAGPASHRKAPDALNQLGLLRQTLEQEVAKQSILALFGMTMESLYRIFGSRRVVLLLKDSDAKLLRARHAIGWNVAPLLGKFTLESDYAPDAFHLAIRHNIPVLINNSKQMREGGKLPAGYLDVVTDAPSFLVLPICLGVNPVGLMYLDWAPDAEKPTLTKAEQAKLVEIRDLLVNALMARRAVVNQTTEDPDGDATRDA